MNERARGTLIVLGVFYGCFVGISWVGWVIDGYFVGRLSTKRVNGEFLKRISRVFHM